MWVGGIPLNQAYIEAISAREKLNAKVPRKVSRNPYTKEAGPPLIKPAWKVLRLNALIYVSSKRGKKPTFQQPPRSLEWLRRTQLCLWTQNFSVVLSLFILKGGFVIGIFIHWVALSSPSASLMFRLWSFPHCYQLMMYHQSLSRYCGHSSPSYWNPWWAYHPEPLTKRAENEADTAKRPDM